MLFTQELLVCSMWCLVNIVCVRDVSECETIILNEDIKSSKQIWKGRYVLLLLPILLLLLVKMYRDSA